jgi:hypothetical protein
VPQGANVAHTMFSMTQLVKTTGRVLLINGGQGGTAMTSNDKKIVIRNQANG